MHDFDPLPLRCGAHLQGLTARRGAWQGDRMIDPCPDPYERKPGKPGPRRRKRKGVSDAQAFVLEGRRYRVARFRLAHPMMPLTMVAKELELPYDVVKHDASEILKLYQQRHQEFADDLVPILAAYYWDTIEKAEAGYERSLRPKVRKHVKEKNAAGAAPGTGDVEKSVQEEEREGNPAWLTIRAQALASLKELYGAGAPAQVNVKLATEDPLRVLMSADPAARKARARELASQIASAERANNAVDAEFDDAGA